MMAIGRIREITFDDGAIVDGDDVTLADLLNPAEIGSGGIHLDNTSGLPTLSPWRSGVVAWDTVNLCMAVSSSIDGNWVQVGQESTDIAINKTGSSLANGTVVYYDGSSANRPKAAKAYCTNDDIAFKTIGLVSQVAGIANNAEGQVTIAGVVRGLNTNSFTEGDILWLDTVAGQYTSTRPSVQYNQIMIGVVTKKDATLGEIYVSVKNLTDQIQKLGFHAVDPHGWTEYDNTYMTRGWVGNTFTLTQVGTSTPYYCKGKLKYLTGNRSIALTPTAGAHFIGLNCSTEVLEDLGATFPILQVLTTHLLVEFAYATGVNVIYNANERHTIKFLKKDWIYKHLSFSTQYRSGITPSITSIDGNGSSITHAQYSVTSGAIADEDIDIATAVLATGDAKKLWYYRADLGVWVPYSEANGTGVIPFGGTGRASYNNVATGLVECTNNYHVMTHLFAANDGTVIGIIGNAEYLTLAAARTAASTEISTLLTTGLPFPEFRAIATFINQTSSTYSNAVKSKIVSVDTGIPYIDWRKTALNPAAGANAANHNQLSSLQGGQAGEYYHLSAAQYGNITNNIFPSGTASNTQNRILLPTATTEQWAALTPTETLIGWDSTKKKPVVSDGTIIKPIGGGLIVTPVTVSGTTPSIATLENGKHYVVDMSTATGDVTVTAPTGASEANWKVTAARNWNNAYRLSIAAAGSDKFYYAGDSTTITTIRIYNPDGWVEGCYLTTNLWVLNTDENGGSGSGGSGQGRKNYILNPSAATSFTDNWTAANLTVARDETSSIPRYTTTKTAFKLTSTSTAGTHTSSVMKRDDADLNRTLGLEIAINCANTTKWTIDVEVSANGTTGWARSVLRSDSSSKTYLPATTGTFKTSFDTSSATPYMRYVITHEGTAAGEILYYSDVLITPDSNTVSGPIIGEWTAYTPTFTGFGTVSGLAAFYKQSGSSIIIKCKFTTGTCTSTEARISLPSGLTSGTTNALTYIGDFAESIVYGGSLQVYVENSASYLTFGSTDASTVGFTKRNATAIAGNGVDICFTTAEFPISQWAGANTNSSGNDPEYCSNSNSTNTATDTTSFAYGPVGSLIPNGAVGTDYTRYVRFNFPVQAGDQLLLEMSSDSGVSWGTTPYPNIAQGTSTYGMRMYSVSSTVYAVVFNYSGSRPSGATYGANGQPWSDVYAVSYRWRVRKVSATSVAGFDIVKETSAGLMPASNSNLDNATATRLGLKQYLHGTTYNGGNSPTVTIDQAGLTINRAVFTPKQRQDNSWVMQIMLNITFNSTTSAIVTSIQGVSTPAYQQQISAGVNNDTIAFAYVNASATNTGIIRGNGSGSVANTNMRIAGEIELASKPTWAY
jgi:hypothetical protein